MSSEAWIQDSKEGVYQAFATTASSLPPRRYMTAAIANALEAELTALRKRCEDLAQELVDAGELHLADETDLVHLRKRNAELESMAPYVESSGHYCDGMTAAWSDAQEAIGRLSDAVAALRNIESGNVGLQSAPLVAREVLARIDRREKE